MITNHCVVYYEQSKTFLLKNETFGQPFDCKCVCVNDSGFILALCLKFCFVQYNMDTPTPPLAVKFTAYDTTSLKPVHLNSQTSLEVQPSVAKKWTKVTIVGWLLLHVEMVN